MDRIVTLDSQEALRPPTGSLPSTRATYEGAQEMIVLNGHLQERLDALSAPRRATR